MKVGKRAPEVGLLGLESHCCPLLVNPMGKLTLVPKQRAPAAPQFTLLHQKVKQRTQNRGLSNSLKS